MWWVVTALGLVLGLVAPAAARPAGPASSGDGFADPSVVRHGGRYLAVMTGRGVPRAVSDSPTGPWTRVGPALVDLPEWVRSTDVWAPDLVRTPRHWVLYFSATVRGLGPRGRCIGVATATDPLGAFTVHDRPLVCPHRADTPPAADAAGSRTDDRHGRPRLGVIDPSGFADRGGRYLLYKTQGMPSTIRVLRLSGDGTGRLPGRRSRELLRRPGIVENPVVVRHRRDLVLITSEGYFGGCGYRTAWRPLSGLERGVPGRRRVLAQRTGSRICGPGGADVLDPVDGRRTVFLHGWTCWAGRRACPPGHDLENDGQAMDARRSLFVARLAWRRGHPVLRLA